MPNKFLLLNDVSFCFRLSLAGEEYETFWKNVQFVVDKDVVRTDRSQPYYAGQDNPNVQKMRYLKNDTQYISLFC